MVKQHSSEYCCTLFSCSMPYTGVTLEPGDVLAEERMTVVISMVIMWENAYKNVILLKMTSTAEVYRICVYTFIYKSCSIWYIQL